MIRTGLNEKALPSRRGFTLIELLVVIAIIALLVSMLMPSLRQAKELARQSACMAHMRQVGTALSMYIPDFDEWMPGYQTTNHLDIKGHVDTEGLQYYFYLRSPLLTRWHGGGSESEPIRNADGFLATYLAGRNAGIHSILSCPSVPRGPVYMESTHRGLPRMAERWGEATFGMNFSGVCEWDSSRGWYVNARFRSICLCI